MDTFLSHPIVLFIWFVTMIALTGVLITRFLSLVQRVAVKIYQSADDKPKWQLTLFHAGAWVGKILTWVFLASIVGSHLGIPPGLITGIGTVLGAALGFGSQEVVRDVVKGAVHLLERQFAVGDCVSLTVAGLDNVGIVEEVSLRAVVISTENQGKVTVPQGVIGVIKNYSSGEGRFVVDLPFETDVDVTSVLDMLEEVVKDVNAHSPSLEKWGDAEDIAALDKIVNTRLRGVSGVDKGCVTMQIEGFTEPGQQFSSRRALLRCVTRRLDDNNVYFKSSDIVKGA